MRALFVQAPEAMLAHRRRLGLDGRDEMWAGVLHVVPPPGGRHQRVGAQLLLLLAPLARSAGLLASYETGLFGSDTDYRVPDQLYCTSEDASERGAEGAQLVVEIRSPGDETYAKLDFYAARGVREVLVIHPDGSRVELFRLVGAQLLPVTGDGGGAVRVDTLGVVLTPGPPLRLSWAGATPRSEQTARRPPTPTATTGSAAAG